LSKIEVNTVEPQCGTTLTLGASGDTVTLGAGASQSGFGRTGTVDWDTTAKTASFTAVSGNGYFVNTTSGAVTMTLPATPSAGDIVSVKDYAYTFATNNLTVARNGSPIGGANTDDVVYSTNGTALTFIYVDGTKGWLVTNESTDTSTGVNPAFITATGGTILTCGNFKTHVFTGPGTFTVCSVGNPIGSDTVDYLVVAGGGGGGFDGGGGGGAGGFRYSNSVGGVSCTSPLANPTGLPVTAQGYPIVVGGGGTSQTTNALAPSGSNSSFSSITSAGGGGASPGGSTCRPSGNGGSGGGVDRNGNSAPQAGTGNTPPVSPPQGSPGNYHPVGVGGGGGGADPAGAAPIPGNSGDGGNGSFIAPTFFGPTAPSYGQTPAPLTSNGRYFAGGGSGGHNPTVSPCATQNGGAGGGGNSNSDPGKAAIANTGGGGGAGDAAGPVSQPGGTGGSGIVIIRYKFQ